jgi:hypothetical protein
VGEVVGSKKANGLTNRMRPPCSSNSVDVILWMTREIIIHHMGNAFDIDAAGGDIGSDKNTYSA